MADSNTSTIRTGIAMMCIAALILPFLNLCAKWLGEQGYPVTQIAWARYAGHLAYLMVLFMPRRGLRLFATVQPRLHVTRSAVLLLSTLSYFSALSHISLPVAASIGFTAPLIVTLLAVPMLGETVGVRRIAAVLVGFSGALIIVRPGTEDALSWAAGLVFVTALSYAMYQLLTRRAGAQDDPVTSVTYTAVVGTVVLSLALPFAWQTPRQPLDVAAFFAIGGFACAGHYFVVKAFTYAPASIISPFGYGQLLGATVLGWLVFGSLPDLWTWVGALLIVASGMYVAWRESRLRARG